MKSGWIVSAITGALLLTGCDERIQSNPSSLLVTDAATHTVNLFLTMARHNENLSANFNGYANGHLVFTIPVGYTVAIHVTNDGGIPYGVGVYDAAQHVAFAGSALSIPALENNPTAGIMPGDSQTLRFVANRVGNFRLENMLYRYPAHSPTHEPLGMWAQFRVVSSGTPQVQVE